MKKIILISSFLFALFAITSNVDAQGTYKLKTAAAADTIHKSTTLYVPSSAGLSLDINELSALMLQVATDSVSGTPDTKYVLQRSLDGTHFYSVTGDTLTPTYIGVNSVHPSSSKYLNVNPAYVARIRVMVYTGSGTQKSKMWVTIKQSTLR